MDHGGGGGSEHYTHTQSRCEPADPAHEMGILCHADTPPVSTNAWSWPSSQTSGCDRIGRNYLNKDSASRARLPPAGTSFPLLRKTTTPKQLIAFTTALGRKRSPPAEQDSDARRGAFQAHRSLSMRHFKVDPAIPVTNGHNC